MAGLRELGVRFPENIDPHTLNAILGEGRAWDERYRNAPEPAPTDRTVGFHVDRYLGYHLTRQRASQISVSDYDQTRQALDAFRSWIGEQASIEAIDADRWQAWYLHLLGVPLSNHTKRQRIRRARDFLVWLGAKGVLAAAGNLHTRKFRFKGGGAKIVTFEDPEVISLVKGSPGQLKLHVLLALNCGFYPVDLSDLTQDEVDWTTGRIVRKRSKAGDKESVPLVNYPLWGVTLDLLRRYATREGEFVLLTEGGNRWVRDDLDDHGRRHRVNAIQSNYAHVKKRLGLTKAFKSLRATAASKLERHGEFGRYAPHFLGHAPGDVARTHYVTPDQVQFDAAVRWLGTQFGF